MINGKRISTLAGFVLVAAMAIPARAEPPTTEPPKTEPPKTEGKCPAGWTRVKVHKAKNHEEAKRVDKEGNKDELVCEKDTAGTHKYTDNNM